MREFTKAVRRESAITNPVTVEFAINGEVLTAEPPTSGQIAYFMAMQSTGDPGKIAQALLELLFVCLGDDYEFFEDGLKAGEIDMEMCGEVLEFLTEEWSARPTSPASGSSPSRGSTGKRSTATKRSAAKTS